VPQIATVSVFIIYETLDSSWIVINNSHFHQFSFGSRSIRMRNINHIIGLHWTCLVVYRGRLKMREWKMLQQVAGVENAGVAYSCMESWTKIVQKYSLGLITSWKCSQTSDRIKFELFFLRLSIRCRFCIFHPCCLLLLFPLLHFQRPRLKVVQKVIPCFSFSITSINAHRF